VIDHPPEGAESNGPGPGEAQGSVLHASRSEKGTGVITSAALCVGDVLVRHLRQAGARYLFGVPGGAITPLYEAVTGESGITPILTKSESGAAFMADGYARVRRTLGVCCTTSGPGATNALTAIACSRADSVPVLLLSGQVALGAFGRGAIQDSSPHGVDVVRLFEPVTKLSALLPNSASAATIIRAAIRAAVSGRPGPAHLSLPPEVMRQALPGESTPLEYHVARARTCDPAAIEQAALSLGTATRPAILAGYGVSAAAAWDELRGLAEATSIPVATTPRAKGVFPEDHPLSLGVFGFGGHPQAEAYLCGGVDVLLVVGSSLSELQTNGWDPRLQPRTCLIQIDIDPTELGKNYPVGIGVVGDARLALAQLHGAFRQSWFARGESRSAAVRAHKRLFPRCLEAEKCHDESTPLKPQRLVHGMRRVLPDDTLCFVDIGNAMLWFPHYFEMRRPASYAINFGLGCMGYAVAAAVGGKLAAPERPVVALAGDGAFAMQGMEIHTAVEHNLPITWVILNDGGFGMVDHGETMLVGKQVSPARYREAIDVVTVAQGLGAVAYRVSSPAQFEEALSAALACGRPCVIDARIDRTEVPPMLRVRAESIGRVFSRK
jgi:acetolactate synthase-1/2/3 large subunit